jgi:hypothetical protein
MTRTGERFRRCALSLAGAEEGSHMGASDFRVHGRIFATLAYEKVGFGTLKLTLEQQASFLAEGDPLFKPAPGGWGRMGMTLVALDAPEDVLFGALQAAYRNVAAKKLATKKRTTHSA